MEIDTLTEMIREHIRLEDDFVQRFQALNRRKSLKQILLSVEKLYEDKTGLTERVNRMTRKLETLEDEQQTAELEKQRLRNHNATLQRKLDEEHAKRRDSEQKQTQRIDELEKINDDLRLEKRKLELDIVKQRQKTRSGAERIRELMKENSCLKEDIREERSDRQQRILMLGTDNLRKEKEIQDLKFEDERRARILQHSNDNITCICNRLQAVQRDLNGLLERPRMHCLTEALYDR